MSRPPNFNDSFFETCHYWVVPPLYRSRVVMMIHHGTDQAYLTCEDWDGSHWVRRTGSALDCGKDKAEALRKTYMMWKKEVAAQTGSPPPATDSTGIRST